MSFSDVNNDPKAMTTANPPKKKKTATRQFGGKTVDTPEIFFEAPKPFRSVEEKRKQALLLSELIEWKQLRQERERDRKRLFLLTGLAVSLLLVIGAFEWKFYGGTDVIELHGETDRFEDMLDVPLTEQPPPTPPQVQPLVITVISDEIEIEEIQLQLDVEVTEDMSIKDPVSVDMIEEPEEEADEVFVIVETKPEPVGGMAAFYAYLSSNLKYPVLARQMNISGRVYVQFIVEKDGSLSSVEVIKGIGGGCDEEAVRVLQNAPAWHPGKQRGRPVKVRMTIPIFFTLTN